MYHLTQKERDNWADYVSDLLKRDVPLANFISEKAWKACGLEPSENVELADFEVDWIIDTEWKVLYEILRAVLPQPKKPWWRFW